MRARGEDGDTQGAKELLPMAKRKSQRKNPEDKRQEGDQEGRLQSFCKQKSDSGGFLWVVNIHYLECLSKCACRYMYILYILCIMWTYIASSMWGGGLVSQVTLQMR